MRPGEAAQAALRESRLVEVQSTFGMHTADEVESLIEALPRAVLSVQWRGQSRFPGFQFVTGVDGGPMLAPAWVRLRDAAPTHWSDADILAWTAAPNSHLQGRSPAEEIRDHPDEMTQALAQAVDMAVAGTRTAQTIEIDEALIADSVNEQRA